MKAPLKLALSVLFAFAALPVLAQQPAQLASAGSAQAGGALAALPPEALVRRVLEKLPQLRLGALEGELAQQDQARLQAGPYEWTLRAGHSQRQVQGERPYQEQELGLERTLRWFGKAGQDQAIGAQGVAVARAMQADAWHEAGRALMNDWFGALREQAAVLRLGEQLAVTDQLRQIAARRLKAGEGARLEQMQAETEHQRVEALMQQARQRQEQALAQLELAYAGLPRPDPENVPLPQATGETGQWRARILHDNHELELAQAEAALSALRASRQASDSMPDPTIGVRALRERGGQEKLIGVSLSIPLPGVARNAAGRAAALQAAMARERAVQVRLRVEGAAQRALIDGMRSYQLWQSLHEVELQARRQSELLMRAYQAGESSLTEALGNRRQALDAALAAQAAQIDALAAEARLQLDAHLIWALD